MAVPQPGIAIQKLEIDGDSNGIVESTILAPPWKVALTFSGAGTVMATVRATDAQGNIYTRVKPIVLVDQATLDQTLRAVWNGMTAALASGDKTRALQYLNGSARESYGPVFDVLLPNMPSIIASFSQIQAVSLSSAIGEYAIVRPYNGTKQLYLIYFTQGTDGVWRVDEM